MQPQYFSVIDSNESTLFIKFSSFMHFFIQITKKTIQRHIPIRILAYHRMSLSREVFTSWRLKQYSSETFNTLSSAVLVLESQNGKEAEQNLRGQRDVSATGHYWWDPLGISLIWGNVASFSMIEWENNLNNEAWCCRSAIISRRWREKSPRKRKPRLILTNT